MNLSRLGGGLAIAGLSIGAAACGGGSGSSSSSAAVAATLEKTALVAKANAICTTAQTASSAVTAPASYADPVVAAAYFDRIVPITDQETQDLLALHPASDVQAAYARFTAAQQSSDTLLRTIRQKAHAKDPSGQQDLAKAPVVGQQVAAAATALGATVCAQ